MATGLAFCEPAAAVERPFSEQSPITSGLTTSALSVDARIADLDGDGDLDIVFANSEATSSIFFGWLENTGSGFTQRGIGPGNAPTSVVVADLDADGDRDVAVTTIAQVRWYESNGASPPSFTTRVILGGTGGQEVFAADVNRDGNLDLVTVKFSDDSVAWYESNGASPPIFTRHVIDEDPDGAGPGDGYLDAPVGVVVFDPDRDGDPDVAAIGTTSVAWFENSNGLGTSWTPHTAISGLSTGTQLAAADLDRDGDEDLVASINDDDRIDWYENDGTPAVGNWTQRTVAGAIPAIGSNVSVADVDADGDVDVLAGSDVNLSLYWFDNDGAAPPSFTSRVAGAPANRPTQHTAAGDLDGDGDADLVALDTAAGQIRWVRNDNIHRSAVYPELPDPLDAAADIPYWVSAADLDRDGDQDALIINVGATGGIRWRANSNGSFGAANLIVSAFHARVIRVADMDRDGDPDLVTAATGTPGLAWLENTAPATALSWTTRTISGTYSLPFRADVGDIDGDGDPDVLASNSSASATSIAWFENTAGNGSAWSEHLVSATPGIQGDVRLADVDGDGDLDLFYGDSNYANIGWKENTAGNGSAWTDHEIEEGSPAAVPNAMEPVDMDRDGDLDVVVASRGSNNSSWFENANGAGTSWTRHSLGSDAKLFSLRASDLDQDGDLDVVGSAEEADRLYVFENLTGDGASWDLTWTPEWLDQPFGIDAADLDRDGDADLLGVGFASEDVIWLRNGGGQFALPTTSKDYQGMVDGRKLDVLRIDAGHRGRIGDSDAEIADFQIRFETESGDPLSSAQADALLSQVRFYLDNGDGVFVEGADDPLLAQGPFTLDNGVAHFTPPDGDANHQLAGGSTRVYFVVATLKPTASSASPKRFQVVHLAQTGSQAEDSSNDLPLSLEFSLNIGSSVIEALPASGDADGDGLSNVAEADTHKSDPLDVDTDADGLQDGSEVNTYGTSPIKTDTEGDGLGDGEELTAYGTNPLSFDTEGDGFCDGPNPIFGCAAGDNCPAISNAGQTNSDAFAAGDACQCGNVDGASGITSADYTLARAGVIKNPGPPFDPDFCDVDGDAQCTVEDLAILQRVVNAQPASVQNACAGYRGQ